MLLFNNHTFEFINKCRFTLMILCSFIIKERLLFYYSHHSLRKWHEPVSIVEYYKEKLKKLFQNYVVLFQRD